MASLHCAFMVGDNDEVASVQEWWQRLGESLHIGLVKGGINFVQNAKRTWTAAENRHEQRHGGHGFFAARKLTDHAGLFARWLGANFHAAFKPINFAVLHWNQIQVRATATKESAEHSVIAGEAFANGLECFLKLAATDIVQFHHQLVQAGARKINVANLLGQLLVLALKLRELVDGLHVDIAKPLDFNAQLLGLAAGGFAVGRHEFRRRALGHVIDVTRGQINRKFSEGIFLDGFAANLGLAAAHLHFGMIALHAIGFVPDNA